MDNLIVRGIVLGGSLGCLAALADLFGPMPRAVTLGMIGGALAGYTLIRIRRKRAARKKV